MGLLLLPILINLILMSRAWVSGRERLNANKSSKPTSSLDNSYLYDEIQGLDYEIEIVDNDNDNNYEESSYDTSLNISKKNLFDVINVASCQKKNYRVAGRVLGNDNSKYGQN